MQDPEPPLNMTQWRDLNYILYFNPEV
jgi:hypothetical protein